MAFTISKPQLLFSLFLITYILSLIATSLSSWLYRSTDGFTTRDSLFRECTEYKNEHVDVCWGYGLALCKGNEYQVKMCHRRKAAAAMMVLAAVAGVVAAVTLGLLSFKPRPTKRVLYVSLASISLSSLLQFIAMVLFADMKEMSKGSYFQNEDDKDAKKFFVKSVALGLGFALAVVSWIGQAGVAAGGVWWRRELLGKA